MRAMTDSHLQTKHMNEYEILWHFVLLSCTLASLIFAVGYSNSQRTRINNLFISLNLLPAF